jgi:hypothetical protein
MSRLRHFDASEAARSTPGRAANRRRSQESGFAFLMALGLIFIALALSLVVLQNFATEGRRQREAETIWRGEQYKRAVRLYYHKVGRYPQTVDDLKKGGINIHFLRQVYKNPMNQKDGTWRFVYVNAAGQVIGSVRYATLQQMVLIDQYAGLIPSAAAGLTAPGQAGLGVSAASLAGSSSGGAANAQQTQLKNVLAAILSPGDTSTDNENVAQLSQQNVSQPVAPPTGMGPGPIGMGPGPTGTSTGSDNQTPNPANGILPANGQLPAGISADQISQYVQNGQLPPGITVDQVAQYIQTVQLPPGVTQQQVMQYVQNLQTVQAPLNLDNSQNPQNPQDPTQPGFGTTPGQPGFGSSTSQSGKLSFGSPSQDPLALNPLLQLKPTGAVEGPVLGAFFTGVACTTDAKSVKYYRRGKKYKEWEFIWNPLEDALVAAQQPGGGQQGGLGFGQASATPGGLGGNSLSNTFGTSSMGPGSTGGPQPGQQQPH